MVPKQINHEFVIFKSGSNALVIVDYPIYGPNYDDRKHSLSQNVIQ